MLSHGSVTASHLSSPRGLKQNRKRMRLAGRPVSELRPPPAPGQWASERASGGASRRGRAREEAGGGAAEVGPCPGGSGAAGSAPSPRCCCCCCSGRRRRRVGRARGAGSRAGGGPQHKAVRQRAGDTWRDAGAVGSGPRAPACLASQGRERVAGLFILRFPQFPRQREEAGVCNAGLELGVLQRFRETHQLREESCARVHPPAVPPGGGAVRGKRLVSTLRPKQVIWVGGGRTGYGLRASRRSENVSGRLHTWGTWQQLQILQH